MTIKQIPLEKGEYYAEICKKDTLYLHDTAGGFRPDYAINGWETDKSKAGLQLPVATAYIMGGLSSSGKTDTSWDGLICQTIPDNMWGHHLGLKTANNVLLNKKSVALEICNYEFLKVGKDGQYFTYVNNPMPPEMICDIGFVWKGYRKYHAYTDKQILSTKEWILTMANKYSIDPRQGLVSAIKSLGVAKAFDINKDALAGKAGLYAHCNVRTDKWDISPQPKMIEMLLSL